MGDAGAMTYHDDAANVSNAMGSHFPVDCMIAVQQVTVCVHLLMSYDMHV